MSGADAWMPLYIGDYLSTTRSLTVEQDGAYLLLIMEYWRNGAPPADETVLARLAKMELEVWRKHAPVLRRFFQEEDGLWRHRRIEREMEAARAKHASASSRGAQGAKRRWSGEGGQKQAGDGPANGPAMAQPLADQWQSQSQSQSQSQAESPSPPASPPQPPPAVGFSDPETPSSSSGLGAAPTKKKVFAAQSFETAEAPRRDGAACAQPQGGLPLFSLPLAEGAVFHLGAAEVARLQAQFSAVDVRAQLGLMLAWLEANPRRRKARAEIMRFVNGWLGREQRQAPKPRPVSWLGPDDVL